MKWASLKVASAWGRGLTPESWVGLLAQAVQLHLYWLLPLIRGIPFCKLGCCSLAGGQNIDTDCKESNLTQLLDLQMFNLDRIRWWNVAESANDALLAVWEVHRFGLYTVLVHHSFISCRITNVEYSRRDMPQLSMCPVPHVVLNQTWSSTLLAALCGPGCWREAQSPWLQGKFRALESIFSWFLLPFSMTKVPIVSCNFRGLHSPLKCTMILMCLKNVSLGYFASRKLIRQQRQWVLYNTRGWEEPTTPNTPPTSGGSVFWSMEPCTTRNMIVS